MKTPYLNKKKVVPNSHLSSISKRSKKKSKFENLKVMNSTDVSQENQKKKEKVVESISVTSALGESIPFANSKSDKKIQKKKKIGVLTEAEKISDNINLSHGLNDKSANVQGIPINSNPDIKITNKKRKRKKQKHNGVVTKAEEASNIINLSHGSNDETANVQAITINSNSDIKNNNKKRKRKKQKRNGVVTKVDEASNNINLSHGSNDETANVEAISINYNPEIKNNNKKRKRKKQKKIDVTKCEEASNINLSNDPNNKTANVQGIPINSNPDVKNTNKKRKRKKQKFNEVVTEAEEESNNINLSHGLNDETVNVQGIPTNSNPNIKNTDKNRKRKKQKRNGVVTEAEEASNNINLSHGSKDKHTKRDFNQTGNVKGTCSNIDTTNINKKKRKKKQINKESNINTRNEMEENLTNVQNTVETVSNQKTKSNVGKENSIPHNATEEAEISSGNESDDDEDSEFDMDSYPSDTDTDDEIGKPPLRSNFAEVSSEESSSDSSDDDSQHTFDADSYPSDTEDEEEQKKGLPINAPPSAEVEEKEKRTIFVGNLPNSVERKQLKKWFFKFGNVESVRLRSAPIADPKLPRKVAVIKKAFHESRSNIHAYIRFKTIEAAKNALQANGATFEEHILRVDCSKHEGSYDSSKAVFVGNVPFDLEEDGMRIFFSECGDIDSVRIIRDKNTGVGKGFAYVNFNCSTAVALALKLDGETLGKRELRVKPIKYQKKNAKPFLKLQPPQYHSKKFYNKKPNNKTKKLNKFQGEISQKRVKNNSKKKSADERKREKFSKILSNKGKKKNSDQ